MAVIGRPGLGRRRARRLRDRRARAGSLDRFEVRPRRGRPGRAAARGCRRIGAAGRAAGRHRAAVRPDRRRPGRGRPSGGPDPSQRRQGLPAALPRRRRQERPRRRLHAGRHPAHRRPPLPPARARRPTRSGRCAPWCAAATTWSRTRVALANQLRSLLEGFWPGAAAIFADIDSPIALAFLDRYPDARTAPRRLGEKRLAGFLAQHRYCGRRTPAEGCSTACAPRPNGLAGEAEAEAKGEIVRALARTSRKPWSPRSPSSPPASSTPSPSCPTAASSCPSRAPAASAPPRSSPSSATCASASRPSDQLAAEAGVCPVTHAARQDPRRRLSAGPATTACAPPSPASPTTPATPPPGPPTSTAAPAPAAATTPTPSASSPALGSASSGAPGRPQPYDPGRTPRRASACRLSHGPALRPSRRSPVPICQPIGRGREDGVKDRRRRPAQPARSVLDAVLAALCHPRDTEGG